MNVLIIGGSRFIGPILISKFLANSEYKLTVFNRGKNQRKYDKEITFIRGNRNFKVNIRGHFDVVIDMCAYNKKQLENVIDSISFDHFINFGTAASYRKTSIFPLTESSKLGYWPIWGSYNEGKVECEKLLQKKKIKYATIRPVYILGVANYINRESFLYSKVQKEERIVLPGDGQAICQFTFAEDVANILYFLTKSRLEGAFNIAGDELVTLQGLIDIMARIVGKTPKIEFNPLTDGMNYNENEFPFANENFICSNNKLKQLGIKFSPLVETLELQYNNFYRKILR